MFPEDKQEEVLATAEWIAKATSKAETYKNELSDKLFSLNFTSLMIERLVQFIDSNFKMGDVIESKICILTKDRTICIANEEIAFFFFKSKRKRVTQCFKLLTFSLPLTCLRMSSANSVYLAIRSPFLSRILIFFEAFSTKKT